MAGIIVLRANPAKAIAALICQDRQHACENLLVPCHAIILTQALPLVEKYEIIHKWILLEKRGGANFVCRTDEVLPMDLKQLQES